MKIHNFPPIILIIYILIHVLHWPISIQSDSQRKLLIKMKFKIINSHSDRFLISLHIMTLRSHPRLLLTTAHSHSQRSNPTPPLTPMHSLYPFSFMFSHTLTTTYFHSVTHNVQLQFVACVETGSCVQHGVDVCIVIPQPS